MKKIYNTPKMSFSEFHAENIITTSTVNTLDNSKFNEDVFNSQVTNNSASTGVQKSLNFHDYSWK